MTVSRKTHRVGRVYAAEPLFVELEARYSDEVGNPVEIALRVLRQIVIENRQNVSLTELAPPGGQVVGIASRLDQLGIARQSFFKTPVQAREGPLHFIQ